MPMSDPRGGVVIVYNGEVYNFAVLRAQLQAAGVTFRSHTDTEVVLRLYEREGPRFVQRLNGMFAIAICDLRSGSPEVFLARDHFGVKPLYFAVDGQRLAFASEVKALLALPGLGSRMDPASLRKYLTFLWVPEPDTLFAGVQKLPAGSFALWRSGALEVERYWNLDVPEAGSFLTGSEEDLVRELGARFSDAVHRQMVSDVPVGAFLSGGLDSSGIVAMMAERSAMPVKTYTVTFPEAARVGENTLDDPRVALEVARRFGTEHREIMVNPDVADLLPNLIWHMDEPVADPALIAAFLVCEAAREEVTVLMSGVGGDELLGGYRKHYVSRWADQYRRMPARIQRFIEASGEHLPPMQGTRFSGQIRLAKKMIRSARLPFDEAFIQNAVYMSPSDIGRLLTPEAAAMLPVADPLAAHRAHFDEVRHAAPLNQMLYVDTKMFMPSLNLLYNDKMSMASSLEVRVPFLDVELAEWVQRLPLDMKIRGTARPVTKFAFRQALQGILPPAVLKKRKAGFGAPLDHWLAHGLQEMVDDILSPDRVRSRGLFRPAAVRSLIDAQRTGRAATSMQIWQLITLELWMDAFKVSV